MEAATGKSNRMLYYDLLRIAACFSVVMLHSASQYWYDRPVHSAGWLAANAYDGVFRFGVPMFVMLSGALFLDPGRGVDLKRLYSHNILRLFVAYVAWSMLYAAWEAPQEIAQGLPSALKTLAIGVVEAKYHLWFIPMMIGIYMVLPVLRTWVEHAPVRQLEYFLLLFVVLQIGKSTVVAFVPPYLVVRLMNLVPVEMVQSYLGYFILGYYLAHVGLPKKLHKWVYLGGVLGALGAVAASSLVSWWRNGTHAEVFDSYSLFTFLVTVALFLAAKEKGPNTCPGKRVGRFVTELSSCTFGIYLLHLLVLELFSGALGPKEGLSLLWVIPLLAIVSFGLCFLVIFVARRIPVVGKWIC